MILAYHVILSAYGFWLPNDPRGSWSEFVRAYELYRSGGRATTTGTRRSVAHQGHDTVGRLSTKQLLAREPVRFNGRQARAIARGFADYCRRTDCVVHACAVLPDHAHLVVARRALAIERTAEQLKAAATGALGREGLHPFATQPYRNGRLPTPWARHGWWVYLDSLADVQRAIAYVEANPVKAGLRVQRWRFVTRWNGGRQVPLRGDR